jgi:DNA adenine methylase
MATFCYDAIRIASHSLKDTVIKVGTFQQTMRDAVIVPGRTLVFCDPPYLGEFSSYDKSGFTREGHLSLAQWSETLRDEGALVIVCGSDNEHSRAIYGKPHTVIELQRTVGASNRSKAREALYVYSP